MSWNNFDQMTPEDIEELLQADPNSYQPFPPSQAGASGSWGAPDPKRKAGATGSWGSERPAPRMSMSAKRAPAAPAAPQSVPADVLAKMEQDGDEETKSLVQRYREKMKGSDEAVASAEKMQKFGGYADVAGQVFTDFNNAGRQDIILKNRMQDLGQKPDIVEAKRDQWKSISPMFDKEVANAKGKRKDAEDEFFMDDKLGELDRTRSKDKNLNDPKSKESMDARAYLKQIAPKTTNFQGYDNLSAAQIKEMAPQLYKAYSDDMDRNQKASEAALKAKGTGGDVMQGVPTGLRRKYLEEEGRLNEYNNMKNDVLNSANEAVGVGLVEGNVPNWAGGRKSDWQNVKAKIVAAIVGKVPGLRSDKDVELAVLPMIPQPGDTPKAAQDRLKRLEEWLEANTPDTPTVRAYTSGEANNAQRKAPRANEVKRKTPDGKTAVFNADTKEFIRYEQ